MYAWWHTEGGADLQIYADEAFALNGAVNYLLLLCGARLAGAGIRRGRLILAAGLGAAYAVLALVPSLAFLQTWWMKLWSLAVMTLAAFGWSAVSARAGVLAAAAGACLAGLVLASGQLMGARALLLPGGGFYAVSVPGLVLLASGLYMLCRLMLAPRMRQAEILPLTLTLGSGSCRVRALRDTGNTLRDPITNEQILVADLHALRALLPQADVTAQQLAAPADILPQLAARFPQARFRLVPYRSVGMASGLLLAARCTVTGAGRRVSRLTAFSPTPVSTGGSFDALTGGEL